MVWKNLKITFLIKIYTISMTNLSKFRSERVQSPDTIIYGRKEDL